MYNYVSQVLFTPLELKLLVGLSYITIFVSYCYMVYNTKWLYSTFAAYII